MVKRIKLRTLLIGGFITLLFVVLIFKVFSIQIVHHKLWHDYALSKWSRNVPLPASRGTITDRNGDVLATDAPAYTVIVQPKVIHENGLENDIVEGLHRILNKDEGELRALVTAKNDKGEYWPSREVRNEGWMIDQATYDKVSELNDELKEKLKKSKVKETGLSAIKETKRYYPKGTLASHILGYTDREGNPVAGLEVQYNKELQGTDGVIKYQSDGQGDKLPDPKEVYKPAVNGKNLKLTIDDTIQYYIEEAMKKAYAEYNPISMTVIAADPKTMDILGMANLPTFDPNKYWEKQYSTNNYAAFMNHAVKSVYEPGSTFKIITLAGAVQEKVFNPNDKYQSGTMIVKGTKQPLHDINRSGWGKISYLEGVKRSSNVAFVKIGTEMLGKEKLLQYIHNFGFGQKTNIELPGEISWAINLPGPVETATATYGHGVLVTPIQQIAAVSAVANGGKLLKPHIIKEIDDPNTGKKEVFGPVTVRQVISPEAAKETTGYLEQVVSDQKIGTGRHAYIEGYRVAGKTGTAVKYTNGVPDNTKSVVSFIGYAPANNPKIAVLVIMDQPDSATAGGGSVAAPVFKEIVSQSLQYMGVPREESDKDDKKEEVASVTLKQAPDLVGKDVKEARQQLLNAGIAYDTLGKGSKVIKQYPAKGTPLSAGQRIYLLTEKDAAMDIPDLKGESLRDALDILNLMKVAVIVNGEGYITDQKVTNQNGKRTVELTLKPNNSEDENADGDASDSDQSQDQADSQGSDSNQDGKGKNDEGKSSNADMNGKIDETNVQ